MLGRNDQRGLFEADTQYLETVPKESFYAFLAQRRGTLFRDEEFAHLYAAKIGRPSVPPSLLATALLLQTHDGVSDEQAKERADYDLRWKVALGVGIEEHPFAKSTLQLFRAQLVTNGEAQRIFRKSLVLAKKQGVLNKNRKLLAALDTTNILGRGAVKDTYNLLGDGIALLLRQLASLAQEEFVPFATELGYARYAGERSLKGSAALDWDSARERARLLAEIVTDADRLLECARSVQAELAEGSAAAVGLAKAAEVLSQVLLQDITRAADGPALLEGVAKDRMPAVHDPEMRHGRKSAQKRFDGHKAQVAVDTESQLITAVAVLAGNAPDSEQALAMVEQTEVNTGEEVGETVADCAYGSGATRQEFAAAGRDLVAKVAVTRNGDRFPKTDFHLDLATESCVCPAGKAGVARYARMDNAGEGRRLRGFRFAAPTCAACPLRAQCVRGNGGRSIAVHPQEALLQQARALQRSPEFAQYREARQVAEHRLARLVQLGIRQARYFGRQKTLFQLLMAATVANLTLLANKGNWETADGTPATLLALPLLLLGALAGRPQRLRATQQRSILVTAALAPSNAGRLASRSAPLSMTPSRPDL
ncbi:MAG: IS1182 family transposase [Dehalococcoidia bacterium]